MKLSQPQLVITCDHREKPSGIPDTLSKMGVKVQVAKLKAGDYKLNNTLLVERKTRDDFVRSIIDTRLFRQCRLLKKQKTPSILLIEGNPYNTSFKIERNAVQGALLSVAQAWQIPTIYTGSKKESAEILIQLCEQISHSENYFNTRINRPKKPAGQALFFLQCLPGIGPKLAHHLLFKFKTLDKVMLAAEEELMEIEGLGCEKAKQIRLFLSQKY